MSFITNLWRYLLGLPRPYLIGGVVVIALGVIGVHLMTRPPVVASAPPQMSHVSIASVASLSSQAGPLPVVGTVTSLNEATILAQSPGEITSLNHQLGDHVSAGATIASIENSAQQAAVTQAQGAYAAAEAQLAQAQGATAANASLSSAQASGAAETASASAQAALSSAYASLDDAIHTKADTLFTNVRSTTLQPTFILTITDSQLQVNIINERIGLEATIADAQTQTAAASTSIDARIDASTADVQSVLTFLNNVIRAVNEAVVTQSVTTAEIAGYQSSISAARSEVVSALSGLNAAKTAYDAAQTSAATAQNSAGSGTQNSIAAAQANVQQALGALQSAQAALSKTIIRSPISGTIVTLTITQGDYVSSFQQVAQVSNPSALEIDTYVTAADAKTLTVGGKATISGSASGVITSIAPALDPTTGKIKVVVGITGDQSSLTDGESVSLTLERTNAPIPTQHTTTTSTPIAIPLNAVKITPQGPVVFTVSSSTLVANPITLGTILGEQVVATSGLTPDMDIVTDARGLSTGQTVTVDAQ